VNETESFSFYVDFSKKSALAYVDECFLTGAKWGIDDAPWRPCLTTAQAEMKLRSSGIFNARGTGPSVRSFGACWMSFSLEASI